MAEPILCEYLLKLATDPLARGRFLELTKDERIRFLTTLGLFDGPAKALAKFDEDALIEAVENELKSLGGVPIGPHHTIQMSLVLPDSLTTREK
jgi:hypothetical protein